MRQYKSCLIALTLLALSLVPIGCRPKHITGEQIRYLKKGAVMPFDGYAVEKLKMLRLMELADKAVSEAEKPAE